MSQRDVLRHPPPNAQLSRSPALLGHPSPAPPAHRPLPTLTVSQAAPRRLERPLVPPPPPRYDQAQIIIDRLVEAVRTGAYCGTSDSGPRRHAAISPRGLHLLSKYDTWREAMQRIAEIENPHPRGAGPVLEHLAQPRLVDPGLVKNDDAMFAGLRVLLPKYVGPPVVLFRGQVWGQGVGPSWTRSYAVARRFALYEMKWSAKERIPCHIQPRTGAVILKATLHREIISGEIHLKGKPKEAEYVVDPRGVKYLKSFEIEELS